MTKTYDQQTKVPKYTQPLSPQRIKELRNTEETSLSLIVTQEDFDRANCVHRNPSDMWDTLIYNKNDNTHTCNNCESTFSLIDLSNIDIDNIQENAQYFINILESIKHFYLELPENIATDYYKMIPLLKRIPHLFQSAKDNYESNYSHIKTNYNEKNNKYEINFDKVKISDSNCID